MVPTDHRQTCDRARSHAARHRATESAVKCDRGFPCAVADFWEWSPFKQGCTMDVHGRAETAPTPPDGRKVPVVADDSFSTQTPPGRSGPFVIAALHAGSKTTLSRAGFRAGSAPRRTTVSGASRNGSPQGHPMTNYARGRCFHSAAWGKSGLTSRRRPPARPPPTPVDRGGSRRRVLGDDLPFGLEHREVGRCSGDQRRTASRSMRLPIRRLHATLGLFATSVRWRPEPKKR